MKKLLGFTLLASALAAAPARAQERVFAADLDALNCTAGGEMQVFILDASADDDCDNTGAGTYTGTPGWCCCFNGAWEGCRGAGGGGGGLSSSDIDTSAELRGILTDEVGTGAACFVGASATGFFGSGTLEDARVDGSLEADELTLAGDVDGAANANDLDEGAVETELEGVLDLSDLQGQIADGQIAAGAVDGGPAGEIADGSITADDLADTVKRLKSWDNPPASAGSVDDEFNDGDITGWTIGSSGTTNPATSGTIDYTASLTTPIVDAATIPGWAAFQSDSSSVQLFWIAKAYSPDTNFTFLAKLDAATRLVSANGETYFYVQLYNTGDANEMVNFGWAHNGTNNGGFFQINNNGSLTTLSNPSPIIETASTDVIYVVCWKKSDVYHFGYAGPGNAVFSYAGSITKTGVTTFDGIKVVMQTANETPSMIHAIDFLRGKNSLDYSLVNP